MRLGLDWRLLGLVNTFSSLPIPCNTLYDYNILNYMHGKKKPCLLRKLYKHAFSLSVMSIYLFSSFQYTTGQVSQAKHKVHESLNLIAILLLKPQERLSLYDTLLLNILSIKFKSSVFKMYETLTPSYMNIASALAVLSSHIRKELL